LAQVLNKAHLPEGKKYAYLDARDQGKGKWSPIQIGANYKQWCYFVLFIIGLIFIDYLIADE
jgi:hypothetical protein